MTSPGAWVLAVDFGTTNTIAAVADVRGAKILMIDGRTVTPSAVFLNPDGKSWSVGDTAIRAARRRLEWFEPNPKRCVPDGVLFLGGKNVPVGEAITAVLRPIAQEAASQYDGRRPAAFVVTHPANWGAARVRVLVEAAAAAAGHGWPRPQPFSEPIAAAQSILAMDHIPPQARLVVLDLGGGTVDAAVVDRDGDAVSVIGQPQGLDGMGGEDYDGRLAQWMVAEVGAPELYDSLAASRDPEARDRAMEIRRDARNIKEQLSRQATVPAQLPKSPPELLEITPVLVSRAQLEALICGGPDNDPGLAESVAVVSSVLKPIPPGPPFKGVFLTGGCSRIPMLGTLVQERTGLPPLTYGDPTTAVALGAAQFAWKKLQEGRPVPTLGPPKDRADPPAPPAMGQLSQQRSRQLRDLIVLIASLCAVAGLVTGIVVAASHHISTPQTSAPPSSAPPSSAPQTSAPPSSAPPSSAPQTSAPPSSAPPSSAPDDEQQLMNSLDSSILDGCQSNPNEEVGDVIAAVNCIAVNSGPTYQPLVDLLTAGSAQDWFDSITSDFTNSNDCIDGELVGTWTESSKYGGQFGCSLDSNGDLRIVWVINDDIGVIAEGSDAQQLYAWWQQNYCVINGSC